MNIERINNGFPASALVIFVSRESSDTCYRTLSAAAMATGRLSGRFGVDVLVNGNTSLAKALAENYRKAPEFRPLAWLRIWSISVGDKGNAWDTYLHHIWDGEMLVFFMDGYVRLRPDALVRLETAMGSAKDALGGSGVPTRGRTASTLRHEMLAYGGFHGNLCCMRGRVIAEIRQRKIHIPMGMYRVDSLVGAFLCFGLSPAENSWDPQRIVVEALASWDVDPKRWWRWSDVTC